MPADLAPISGIHHITAMAGDPQRNINFYSYVLGQRLVKTTVNFDDPGTYHFYYGDAIGSPGTILTFFPWPNARRGQRGAGEANAIAYAVPADALGYWEKRLAEFGVSTAPRQVRFGETVLPFQDPDGLWLELVTGDGLPEIDHWTEGPIPADAALRGFHSATLQVAQAAASARLLTEWFGWERAGVEGSRARFLAPGGAAGRIVDLVEIPQQGRGRLGAGSIHHIAFRVADDPTQLAWRARLSEAGFSVTDVRDRQYFHSIYFREPSGVLYELATDAPGFLLDESRAALGRELKLPPWLEARRADIQQQLLAIIRPGEVQA
ncbi:MAG TPA: ring-cleaving dioxygenase [Caldilineaceae bacterium]|nr:ring-cleaving dioxygenase [Caldilineaceae bacterium]